MTNKQYIEQLLQDKTYQEFARLDNILADIAYERTWCITHDNTIAYEEAKKNLEDYLNTEWVG